MQSRLGNYDLLQDRPTIEGRHLVLGDRKRRHRILLIPSSSETCGYYLAHDCWLRTRLAAIEAFDPLCTSANPSKSRIGLVPSVSQKHRLILLLRILDAIACADNGFTSVRQVAERVIYRNADFGRTIEWKSSSHRRQTQRLLNQARFYVRGGYRLLLKGRTHQTSSNS